MRRAQLLKIVLGVLSLPVGSCDVEYYPEEVVQWTGELDNGQTYSCWIDFISPMVPTLYPDLVCIEPSTTDRTGGEGSLDDWDVKMYWTASGGGSCASPPSSDACSVSAKRGVMKGIPQDTALDAWCDSDDSQTVFSTLASISSSDTTDSTIHGDGYVQASCTILDPTQPDLAVKLEAVYVYWSQPCSSGLGYDPSGEACLGATPADRESLSGVYVGTGSVPAIPCAVTASITITPTGQISGGLACDWTEEVTVQLIIDGDEATGKTCEDITITSVNCSDGSCSVDSSSALCGVGVAGDVNLPQTFVGTLSGYLSTDSDGNVIGQGSVSGGPPAYAGAWTISTSAAPMLAIGDPNSAFELKAQ